VRAVVVVIVGERGGQRAVERRERPRPAVAAVHVVDPVGPREQIVAPGVPEPDPPRSVGGGA